MGDDALKVQLGTKRELADLEDRLVAETTAHIRTLPASQRADAAKIKALVAEVRAAACGLKAASQRLARRKFGKPSSWPLQMCR